MTDLDLDAIRAAMAEAMHAKDCACGKTMYADHHTPEVPEWYAEMADAALRAIAPTLDRLKANQLPDGGQWKTEYAHRDGTGQQLGDWTLHMPPDEEGRSYCIANGCEARRVWHSPPEPIRPGADPTQPAAPPAVGNDVTQTDPAEAHEPQGAVSEAHRAAEGVSVQDAGRRHQFAEHQFAEPDNNCFIPRSRDWPESREKLQQAAYWYGGRLVPKEADDA